ncbi:MAG TPA: xanthine dehydrogenase family protein subunit M [Thermoleophilia bacterium]|nr:xanthine dehydrogenase family protein subunit M [Thermoleophilia bacterium]
MTLDTYIRPADLEEALAVLAQPGPKPQVVAGGTDFVPMTRKMRMTDTPPLEGPSVLLDLSKLEDLCGVREAGDVLEIGAATTMGVIAAHPAVRELVPVLAAAAGSVGSPLVRNRATVGGNLVTASPSADTAPALLAADATVRMAGAEAGPRELPLAEFFVDYRTTALRAGEIVTHVLVPLVGRPVPGRFEKVGLRNADAISVVCAACEIELDGSICRAARIALGAVAPVPVRALAVEAALRGRELDEDVAAECARLVHEHISPIDDLRASGRYRGWVAEAVVARMVADIAREARA